MALLTLALADVDDPLEVVEEDVLGTKMPVFRHRARSLVEILRGTERWAERECLVFGDQRITFGEHLAHVATVAAWLRDTFGVAKGDRVAILSANRPEYLTVYWAAITLGAVPVAMNAWWAGDEIRYAVADCAPKVLFADPPRLARLGDDRPGGPIVDLDADGLPAPDPSATLPEVAIDEDDPALILYTSGTTGRPKGAVLSHRNIIALLGIMSAIGVVRYGGGKDVIDFIASLPPARPYNNNPFFHVSGLLNAATATLAGGGCLVLHQGRFDPATVLATIERERCTQWSFVPTTAWRLANHPGAADYDLSSMLSIGGGAAPMSEALQQRLREVFPNAAANLGFGYGLTECTSLATIAGPADLLANPLSCGKPLPTVAVEIRDPDGNPLPEGVEGEVCIRSPLVMLGYWGKPEATAAAIREGRWLHTGDIGMFVDGHLVLSSRRSDLILRGGENVYPAEIEGCLEAHPAVGEVAVVGVPDEELGQKVKAFVVPRPGSEVTEAELTAYLRDRLAYYKVPEIWEIRAEPLPRTPTGKVIKPALLGERALAADGGED